MDGKIWPTSEHYFQAQKFVGHEEIVEKVRTAKNGCKDRREIPLSLSDEAALLGRKTDFPKREDWHDVRDDVMFKIVFAKFQQNQEIKNILLSTGNCRLVEHTKNDNYWADGGDGSGKNMLGVILMKVRDALMT
jgi:ribA/ribD-fused uncharacterized protein